MKLTSATNADVLSNLMARLGSRKAADLRAATLFELNRSIDTREGADLLPWFLQKTLEGTFVAGTRSLVLPADFLREEEEDSLALYQSGTFVRSMIKVDTDQLLGTEGQSTYYALSGETFLFEPAFDADYDYRLRYLAASEPIFDNAAPVTNLWLINAYNLVTYSALCNVAKFHVRDLQAAADFDAEAKQALLQLWKFNEARQHANRDYMVED